MDNFNMKQWLQENKIGPYSKTLLSEMNPAAMGVPQAEADAEMQKQDNRDGDWVDNVSMDVVAEASSQNIDAKIEEWEINILGKTYLIDADVDVDFHYESADYEDHMMISQGGFEVESATATITRLGIIEGDDIRDINDPAAIKQIQDLINTDPKLNRALEKEASESIDWWSVGGPEEEDRYEPDMDETVGFVMKTKKSDPDQQF